MICPHECVDQLLERMRLNDQEDPPGASYAEENARNRKLYWPHPSRDELESMLEVSHAASLQPEEGILARFSLAFISPEGLGKKCDVLTFGTPRRFDRRSVAKLAPAVDPDRSSLGVFPGQDGDLSIWGLVHSHKGPLSTEPANGIPTNLRHGSFLNVSVRAPGVMCVYHCSQMHLLYVRGEAHWGLTGGRLQAVLRDRAGVDPRDADMLCQIAERMVLLGRGGTLLITDPAMNVAPGILDLSYRFETPSPLLRDAVHGLRTNGDRDINGLCRAALDFVASLTRVDGAVQLSSDLAIKGFGGKIRLQETPEFAIVQEEASSTSEAGPRTAGTLKLSDIAGMRHRAAALFCRQQEGQALAIVISQDGDVFLFGRKPTGDVLRIGPFALGVGLGVD